ncbi:MAG: hypothetical protein R3C19_02405 [Planctomycetaceae bacterium]
MSPRQTSLPGAVVLMIAACVLPVAGCYNPYMYPRGPYGAQPMYAPPQNLAPSAPGTLYIPESNAPPYEPSSPGTNTYEDATDTWQPSPGTNGGDGQFYQRNDSEGGVPNPREVNPNGNMFDSDLGPTTELHPGSQPLNEAGGVTVTSVSTRRIVPQFGFDEDNYRWLRGILRFDEASRQWSVTYSLTESDRYHGDLNLLVQPHQLQGLRSGDAVDVRGQVDVSLQDKRGRPLYRVQDMRKMSLRIAS